MSSIMIIVFWAVSVEIHCCRNTRCPFLQGTRMDLKSHTVLLEFFTSSSMLQYCTKWSIRQNIKQTHHFVETWWGVGWGWLKSGISDISAWVLNQQEGTSYHAFGALPADLSGWMWSAYWRNLDSCNMWYDNVPVHVMKKTLWTEVHQTFVINITGWTSWLRGQHYWFAFGRSQVQISARREAVLNLFVTVSHCNMYQASECVVGAFYI
jgi:hypothetical protein